MKTGLSFAGIALILLAGCVPSRKYKASEAALDKMRSDSTQMAQQMASLNGNIHDLQNRNTALKQQLDSSSTNYATQQQSLNYYQNYFKDQQNALSQVNEDVKGALTQAGIANGDVEQEANAVYVRLDENELFRRNSTAITAEGKKVLDGLTGVIKDRSNNVNVFVSRGDSAMAAGGSIGSMPEPPRPIHHRTHHAMTTGSSTAKTTGSSTATANAKKVHHHYSSEGSMATYNGPGNMHNHVLAMRRARMVAVANHFLQNGVPKINVTLQPPPADMNDMARDRTIKVTFTPKMNELVPPPAIGKASAMQ